jgi:phage terminase large subunit-like protein
MDDTERARTIATWKTDAIAFFESLYNPETRERFKLNRAQKRFIRKAFTFTDDGRLRYPELVFSGPKKSGKTTLAALVVIYIIIFLAGPYGEAIIVANDLEQAQNRVFEATKRIIKAFLGEDRVKISASRIEIVSTGSVILAISSDYASASGSNANIVVFDELWAFTSERSRRLWDELVPPPTRKIAVRLTTTYAGFSSESELLEELYKRGLAGEEVEPSLYEQPGLLMAWHHEPIAPWQTPEWVEQMRASLRANAFRRLIQNEFVTSESNYVDMNDFDRCVDPDARPVLSDPNLRVWIGLDGSYQHDSTGVAAVTYDNKEQKVRLVAHKIFTPTKDEPIDFGAVEEYLLELRRRFAVRQILFDPFQLISLAQRMTALGLPMEPFTQTSSNLEAAATNLAELIRHHNLSAYEDSEVRLALSRTVAVETPRGVRISKSKASHRVDVIAALSFAAFGAVREGQFHFEIDHEFQQRAAATLHAAAQSRHGTPSTPGRSIREIDAAEDAANSRRPMLLRARWPRWGNF